MYGRSSANLVSDQPLVGVFFAYEEGAGSFFWISVAT